MADWHTSRRGSHLLLPSLSLPALPSTSFSQAGSSPSAPWLASALENKALLCAKASSPPAQWRFRWNSESRTTPTLPSSKCCCLSPPLLLHQVQPGQDWTLQQALLTQWSQQPGARMCVSLPKRIPSSSREGHSRVCLRGMHKQERQSCCSLQELPSISPGKNPTRACHPPALVLSDILQAGQGWGILTKSFTHWHKMQ